MNKFTGAQVPTRTRSEGLNAPALVIHGESDMLVPPANAKLIAQRIPGAKLVMIPHASHIFATDQPDVAHQAIFEFLFAQVDRHSHVRA
jgi:pimeloyl-ACP methyl ester carboxylesterase